jgi:hypothetical protein
MRSDRDSGRSESTSRVGYRRFNTVRHSSNDFCRALRVLGRDISSEHTHGQARRILPRGNDPLAVLVVIARFGRPTAQTLPARLLSIASDLPAFALGAGMRGGDSLGRVQRGLGRFLHLNARGGKLNSMKHRIPSTAVLSGRWHGGQDISFFFLFPLWFFPPVLSCLSSSSFPYSPTTNRRRQIAEREREGGRPRVSRTAQVLGGCNTKKMQGSRIYG